MIKKLKDKKNKRIFCFNFLVFRIQSDKFIPPKGTSINFS